MLSSKLALWFVRKAVYVAAGAAIGVVGSQVAGAGPTGYELGRITLAGALSAAGAAIVGDLRRAFVPDLFQIASGQDPRSDG